MKAIEKEERKRLLEALEWYQERFVPDKKIGELEEENFELRKQLKIKLAEEQEEE